MNNKLQTTRSQTASPGVSTRKEFPTKMNQLNQHKFHCASSLSKITEFFYELLSHVKASIIYGFNSKFSFFFHMAHWNNCEASIMNEVIFYIGRRGEDTRGLQIVSDWNVPGKVVSLGKLEWWAIIVWNFPCAILSREIIFDTAAKTKPKLSNFFAADLSAAGRVTNSFPLPQKIASLMLVFFSSIISA